MNSSKRSLTKIEQQVRELVDHVEHKHAREEGRDAGLLMYLNWPVIVMHLRDAAEDRARRRFVSSALPARAAWVAWGALSEADQEDRLRHEFAELDAIASHADMTSAAFKTAVETWVQGAFDIAPMHEEESGPYLLKRFWFAYDSDMRNRQYTCAAEAPESWKVATGWRPGMTDDELWDFDCRLLQTYLAELADQQVQTP